MSAGWIKTWIDGGMLMVPVAQGDTQYRQDGITLAGTIRMATRGAAVCQVLTESHPEDVYAGLKANHGQPLHVLQMDFAPRNVSGPESAYDLRQETDDER